MILYVLSGLPGAGKTTRALELAATRKAIMLCRDELRVSYRNAIDESDLTQVMARQALFLLEQGYDVVVDSWNLEASDEDLWYCVAADARAVIQWIHLNTPVEVCVSRDAERPLSIGEDCVRGAAQAFEGRLKVLAED